MRTFPRISHAIQFFVILMGLSFPAMAASRFSANLSVSPSQINYGNNPVNSGPYQYVALTNRGRFTVRISQVAITGAFNYSGITAPYNLAAGKTVSVQVKFVPKTTGTFTGTFSVTSNAPKVSVALSGMGTSTTGGGGSTPGTLTISPTSLSFGNVTVGTSVSKTVSLTANTSPVSISAASTTNQEFTLSNLTLPATIAAGKSISVTVNFKPSSSGSTSAQFSLTDNASNSPGVITATGAGVAVKQHTVGLTWAPSTSSVVGYNVYRGTATGGPYSKLNSSALVSTSYSDTTVNSGSTYFYVTTAMNSSGVESSKSNEVRTVIPIP